MNQTTREKVDESQASYLGIQGADVSSEASQMYGMPTGVAVSAVVEGGPAARQVCWQGISSQDLTDAPSQACRSSRMCSSIMHPARQWK